MIRPVQIEGAYNSLKGRCEEAWGVLTEDPAWRARGAWDQLVGGCQQRFPEAMERVDRARRDLAHRVDDLSKEWHLQ